MKAVKIIYFSLIALVVIVGVYLWAIADSSQEVSESQGDGNIAVETPLRGALVESPLEIRGEARLFFFEGDFPIVLKDQDGEVLGTGIAMAQGEWMTEDFVPFVANLSFNVTEETDAIIEFHKDNPSRLPEYSEMYAMPVRLSPSLDTTSFSVFFGKYSPDSSMDVCDDVYPVVREVPKTLGVGTAALESLLQGPEEGEEGFFTSIPEDTRLLSLRIEDGIAYADFSGEMNRIGGSCRVTSIRTQIEETLKQFPAVSDVVISVEGNAEEALQP